MTVNRSKIALSCGLTLLTASLIYFLSSSPVFAQTTTLPQAEQNVGQNQDGDQKIEDKATSNGNSQQKAEQPIESSPAANQPVPFERGGLDKASEHLQILQQTTPHFVDTYQARKPASVDKKLQGKPQSNS